MKLAPGVIHVEVEDFDKDTMGGQGGFGAAKVSVENCHLGGKQVRFPAIIGDLHLGYKIDVPKTGTYMMGEGHSQVLVNGTLSDPLTATVTFHVLRTVPWTRARCPIR